MTKPENTLAEIIHNRYEELKELRAAGTDPYPRRYGRTHTVKEAKATPIDNVVKTTGRVVQLRLMGKASFAHIQDVSGKMQIYVKSDDVGADNYTFFKKHIHVGDFIGVEGTIFTTKTGEISIHATNITLLSKAVRPMPEKFHGIQDTEIRYRNRHLDLLANEEIKELFKLRSKIVRAVRNTLDSEGFLEVETPILCASAGGASANPFITHHNALHADMYMRIALELFLKRLIIGGLDRVYEIGKVFRNEGIDTRHNPEFTMLEAYQAYSDYNGMALLFERIITNCCKEVGTTDIEYRGQKFSLKPPFDRVYLPEIWQKTFNEDIHNVLSGKSFNRENLIALAKRIGIKEAEDLPSAKLFDTICDEHIICNFKTPTFLMDYPTAITPLAKCKEGDESLVERFEFFVAGDEMCNAYTELNDPEDQMSRLEEQARQRTDEANTEVDSIDKDFVEAMEAGMPPTGGIGIGIDRLTMVLTGNQSIREIVLFPTMKQEGEAAPAKEQ